MGEIAKRLETEILNVARNQNGFERSLYNYFCCHFDVDTGKVRIKEIDWHRLGMFIVQEVLAVKDGDKSRWGSPRQNLIEGIRARKRTTVYRKFYMEHVHSGRCQSELLEACTESDDVEKIIDNVKMYIQILHNKLEMELSKI